MKYMVYMFSYDVVSKLSYPTPGIIGQKYSCPSETFHGMGGPDQSGEINSNTIAIPKSNGSPRMLHSSVKIGMHCFFAYYSTL